MSLKEDISTEIGQILTETWIEENTNIVPEAEKIRLNNHAKNLDKATVLYADLDGSTNMVDKYTWQFSAEIYKAYLRAAARVIRSMNGEITAYDGDRIMAIFVGDAKNTDAVKVAMKINWVVHNIINPKIAATYDNNDFKLDHKIGIDMSQLRAARIGVRGYNDLVWIGRAANYAAKLTECKQETIWITKAVYDVIHAEAKYVSNSKENMWTQYSWTSMNNIAIYGSSYTWSL